MARFKAGELPNKKADKVKTVKKKEIQKVKVSEKDKKKNDKVKKVIKEKQK